MELIPALWEMGSMAKSRVRQHVLQQLRARSDDESIDEMFNRPNPNPDRVGCPSRHVLVELVGRVRPIGDAWYDHLRLTTVVSVQCTKDDSTTIER